MGTQTTRTGFISLTITRLKDSDVTWLYGPLYPVSQPRPVVWQTDENSILRQHREFKPESSSRGKKRIELQVRFHEEVEVIGYDGGLGYFEDEDDNDTALPATQDPYT